MQESEGICKNLEESARLWRNLQEFTRIYKNLQKLTRICKNPQESVVMLSCIYYIQIGSFLLCFKIGYARTKEIVYRKSHGILLKWSIVSSTPNVKMSYNAVKVVEFHITPTLHTCSCPFKIYIFGVILEQFQSCSGPAK